MLQKSKDVTPEQYYKDFINNLNSDNDAANCLLPEENFDPNYKYKSGNTLIILAAMTNRIAVVKMLVEANANLNIENRDQVTAFTASLNLRHLEVALELYRAGANITEGDLSEFISHCRQENKLNLATRFASIADRDDLVKALLAEGRVSNKEKTNKASALTEALQDGHLETVIKLYKAGAVINNGDAIKFILSCKEANKLDLVSELWRCGGESFTHLCVDEQVAMIAIEALDLEIVNLPSRAQFYNLEHTQSNGSITITGATSHITVPEEDG